MESSIANFFKKIDKKDATLVIGITLISIVSFCAGFFAGNKTSPPLIIESSNVSLNNNQQGNELTGNVEIIASKNSKYYHWPWSSWAKNIKEGNKLVFHSEQEARNAGYEPSSSFYSDAPAGYEAQ